MPGRLLGQRGGLLRSERSVTVHLLGPRGGPFERPRPAGESAVLGNLGHCGEAAEVGALAQQVLCHASAAHCAHEHTRAQAHLKGCEGPSHSAERPRKRSKSPATPKKQRHPFVSTRVLPCMRGYGQHARTIWSTDMHEMVNTHAQWNVGGRATKALLLWCYSGVTLVLLWCCSDVTLVLLWCYSGVTAYTHRNLQPPWPRRNECPSLVLLWCHSGVTLV
eukprot:1112826-Pyramimonas_sp.AAC.2